MTCVRIEGTGQKQSAAPGECLKKKREREKELFEKRESEREKERGRERGGGKKHMEGSTAPCSMLGARKT